MATIIVTRGILKRLPMLGTDLSNLSLEKVRMFYRDARGRVRALGP